MDFHIHGVPCKPVCCGLLKSKFFLSCSLSASRLSRSLPVNQISTPPPRQVYSECAWRSSSCSSCSFEAMEAFRRIYVRRNTIYILRACATTQLFCALRTLFFCSLICRLKLATCFSKPSTSEDPRESLLSFPTSSSRSC